jgi:ubiquinol oxidase
VPNPPAPELAIAYWKLPADARLRDVVIAVRADEAGHRDVNHAFADSLRRGDAEVAAKA